MSASLNKSLVGPLCMLSSSKERFQVTKLDGIHDNREVEGYTSGSVLASLV